ncbi:GNAT family N-acetyltransferase [Kitasatospora sp. NBC_01287]|uniref:GNAT family N-acetyltransferase n=1 Tax=Kitasatospora sp. NBC_01287 TaxID=2903573 RepID=UPI00224FEA16|nr:GNAT family N-acetyltransferase [Kitasatospora sp. NBC_01287]MCX4746285.1 GNAT family N-acetyltransferase [Kitasatospora sp. NBC_01287]
MTHQIRDFAPADAGDAVAAAACQQAGRAYRLITPEVAAWQVRVQLAGSRYRHLLAELDGTVVGSARCALAVHSGERGQAHLDLSVLPGHRGRGAGRALLAAAEDHLRELGATHAHGWADEERRSLAFAERHGYRPGRAVRFARLDLSGPLPRVPSLPPGVELRTAADFLDDPRPIHRLDVEAGADEPGDLSLDAMGYQEWHETVWSRPDQAHELTVVAVVAGEPVALSAVLSDGRTRYWSNFTVTRSAHRGRGLAKAAKTASLHRARAAGLTEAFTANDETNEPMLAINSWLGYTRCGGQYRVVREL